MKILTRVLSPRQAMDESVLRVIEQASTNDRRADDIAAPRFNAEAAAPRAQSFGAFNAGVRAAIRADEPVAATGADVNGIAPPPSLNASIKHFIKKGFSR
jgi:hypothetical protein